MATYAVINDSDGVIVNRIVLDDPGAWEVPAGTTVVEDSDAVYQIGGTLIGGVYSPPLQPPPIPAGPPALEPTPRDVVLYDHENRLRSLEGQPPLELSDFLAKIGLR